MRSVWLLAAMALAGCAAQRMDDLQRGFADPPPEARPRTWWHWVSGNVSREGITADLEAMKREGVGGAQLFSVDQGPKGPVVFMSQEWRDLVKHAVSECARLGLELTIHNCEGWSESGGPWITPDISMQKVVWSEQRVHGPASFAELLPQPETIREYYRDIAVLAFPSLPGEQVAMAKLMPHVSTSAGETDGTELFDGDVKTTVSATRPSATQPTTRATTQPAHITLEFAKPLRCSSVTIAPLRPQVKGEVQISEDGKEYHTIGSFSAGKKEKPRQTVLFDEVSSRWFRILATPGRKGAAPLVIGEIEMGGARMADFRAKSGIESKVLGEPEAGEHAAADMIVRGENILNLTAQMDGWGELRWDVPEGDWTIVRLGTTSTGRVNAPAMPDTRGLECDKLSRAAVQAHFNGMVAKLLEDSGWRATEGWKLVLMDSWEAGCQNWTPRFREEFTSRCGYDPLPWMTALTGRFVLSAEATERFLWDYRRTIADLIAENHYGLMRSLCHEHGLGLQAEVPGIGMPVVADELQCKGQTDIPMGEFWVGRGHEKGDPKEAASAAHIYGKSIAAAESFTAQPELAGWTNDPASLKSLGDLEFCLGINRFVFHRYAHQPYLDRVPGVTMGPWGINFERTNTWWEPGAAWLTYISRCQYLLQRGLFVADICYWYGEDAPMHLRPTELKPAPPAGYDYDVCNTEVLLKRMAVKDGMLVLPDGMSYRVLVLPESRRMTPAAVMKIAELVAGGATVIGPKPQASPSLSDFPRCDQVVKAMAAEVWGDCDGKSVKQHNYGLGQVLWGEPLEKVLSAVGPDFLASGSKVDLLHIHRRIGQADVYFVSNQAQRYVQAECSFRVSGKRPELWHADTGTMEYAAAFSMQDGRTMLPLELEPSGSVFVVFHGPVGDVDPVVSVKREGRNVLQESPTTHPAGQVKIQKALYGDLDAEKPRTVDVTAAISKLVGDGSQQVRADNDMAGSDPAPQARKKLRVEYLLNGVAKSASVDEGELLEILPADAGQPSGVQVRAAADGAIVLTASHAGNYQITMALDYTRNIHVDSLPQPQPLSGPWQLRFQKDRGAPESIILDELISWPKHSKDGVKYFSGTATYVKDFDLSAALVGTGQKLWLDLGKVKNLAEVNLNGRELGVLWKPPFRVDITNALRPGRNHLEVKLTNLWPNRLIGDQQLAEDKRLTWTTHNPYKKDSPLLESGLLGPVVIQAGQSIEVK